MSLTVESAMASSRRSRGRTVIDEEQLALDNATRKIKNDILDVVEAFLYGDASIPVSNYLNFWSIIRNPYHATFYSTLLLTKLHQMDQNLAVPLYEMIAAIENGGDLAYSDEDKKKQKAKKKDKGTVGDVLEAPEQALLQTILCLSLFYPRHEGEPLFEAIRTKWIERIERAVVGIDYVDEVMHLIAPGSETQSDTFVTLIDQLAHINCHDGLAFFPETNSEIVKSARFSSATFIYTFLRESVARGIRTKEALETIIGLLRNPDMMPTGRLLALLFMLRELITINPLVDTKYNDAPKKTNIDNSVLKAAVQAVKPYLLWPVPHGAVAMSVLEMLSDEIRVPGTAMRYFFMREHPELEVPDDPTNAFQSSERTVYILIDKQALYSKGFLDSLRAAEPEEGLNKTKLRGDILSALLDANLGERDYYGVELCSPEILYKFFISAFNVMKLADEMVGPEAQAFRLKKFQALKTIIMRHTKAVKSSTIPPPRTRYEVPIPGHMKFEYRFFKNDSLQSTTTMGATDIPHSSALDIMDELLGDLAQRVPRYDDTIRPLVRICVAGGDAALHEAAAGYLGLCQERSELVDMFDVQFFYVPLEDSSAFGSFMGAYDGWYERHVQRLVPSTRRLIPILHLQPGLQQRQQRGISSLDRKPIKELDPDTANQPPMSDDPTKIPGLVYNLPPTPSSILRLELESYFRSAQNILPVTLFQCECWSQPLSPGAPEQHRAIPFVRRAEIGHGPCQQSWKDSGDSKSFKYTGIELSFKFAPVNATGLQLQAEMYEPKNYHKAVLANTPQPEDNEEGTVSSPTTPWLEMSVFDYDKKKSRRGEFIAPRCSHVSYVEIKAENKKGYFDILLDDILYKGFTRVRFSPARVSGRPEDIVSFPVNTFLPFQI